MLWQKKPESCRCHGKKHQARQHSERASSSAGMSLLRFLWDFVIGDDWRIAAGVAVALALTAAFEWWWLLPLAVAALLGLSVARYAARRRT